MSQARILPSLAALVLVATGACSRDERAPRTSDAPSPPVEETPANVVLACVDEVPWFPFTYPDESEPGRLTGATTELVREALRREGLILFVEPLPWNRCAQAVQRGQFNITYDAILADDRRERFLLSKPFYAMPQVFYYLASRYPKGLGLQKPADIDQLRICGVLGYSYSAMPFDPSRIDADARSPSVMLDKLRAGRCDVALGYERPFSESAERGALALDGLMHAPIPGSTVESLGMIAGRDNKRGGEVIALVDQVMAELREDGTYASVMTQFGVERYAVGIDVGERAAE